MVHEPSITAPFLGSEKPAIHPIYLWDLGEISSCLDCRAFFSDSLIPIKGRKNPVAETHLFKQEKASMSALQED